MPHIFSIIPSIGEKVDQLFISPYTVDDVYSFEDSIRDYVIDLRQSFRRRSANSTTIPEFFQLCFKYFVVTESLGYSPQMNRSLFQKVIRGVASETRWTADNGLNCIFNKSGFKEIIRHIPDFYLIAHELLGGYGIEEEEEFMDAYPMHDDLSSETLLSIPVDSIFNGDEDEIEFMTAAEVAAIPALLVDKPLSVESDEEVTSPVVEFEAEEAEAEAEVETKYVPSETVGDILTKRQRFSRYASRRQGRRKPTPRKK